MKVLVAIVVFVFVAWQVDAGLIRDYSKELDEDDEACINELHLNRDEIAAVDMTKTLPETDDFSKFMACSGRRQGVITSSNQLDYAKFTEEMLDVAREDPEFTPDMFRFYKQIITTSIDECHQPATEDVGHALVKTMNCLTNKLAKLMEE